MRYHQALQYYTKALLVFSIAHIKDVLRHVSGFQQSHKIYLLEFSIRVPLISLLVLNTAAGVYCAFPFAHFSSVFSCFPPFQLINC